MRPNISDLTDATRDCLKVTLRQLDLNARHMAWVHPRCDVNPVEVPALSQIVDGLPASAGETLALCQAVQRTAPYMHWQRSCSQAAGFAKSILYIKGWFNLPGSARPDCANGLHIMFSYCGTGLNYPKRTTPPSANASPV